MKQVTYFAILSLSLLLLFNKSLYAEPMRVTENLRSEMVLLPSSAPDKVRLSPVSFLTIVTEEEIIIGGMVTYDDPETERAVDYVELYDNSGGLLLASWVDRFGILRTAMDIGLLQEDSQLAGVLVLLVEGIPS